MFIKQASPLDDLNQSSQHISATHSHLQIFHKIQSNTPFKQVLQCHRTRRIYKWIQLADVKNCQINICPVYKIRNPLANCKGCGKFEGEKAFLLAYPVWDDAFLATVGNKKSSPQLKVQYVLRGEKILNIQTAVALLAKITVQLVQFGVVVSSLVHGALLHEQGRQFGSDSQGGWGVWVGRSQRLARTITAKSCQLQARGPPFIPVKSHTKGGMERLYRPSGDTGRHLWGDDVSLWNRGPTGWAQIDRAT